jgi:uncharacterized membrane protein
MEMSVSNPVVPNAPIEGARLMVRIAATEERVLAVEASPEQVYAFFSNPETLSGAMDAVECCQRLPENQVRWVLAEKVDKGIRFRGDYTVSFEGDGREHIRWRSLEGNMHNDGDVWIRPRAGGGTEIHYREHVAPDLPITPLLARLIAPLVARELRSEINAFLARVQDRFARSDAA